MKRISILGSTGSIGRQCLSVVDSLPGRFEVVALAAGSNVRARRRTNRAASPEGCFRRHRSSRPRTLRPLARSDGIDDPLEILFGAEGIERVATHPDAETVVSAAVGVVGLPATYKAIEHGKNIALANKEVLVAAGEVVMAAVARHSVDASAR